MYTALNISLMSIIVFHIGLIFPKHSKYIKIIKLLKIVDELNITKKKTYCFNMQ